MKISTCWGVSILLDLNSTESTHNSVAAEIYPTSHPVGDTLKCWIFFVLEVSCTFEILVTLTHNTYDKHIQHSRHPYTRYYSTHIYIFSQAEDQDPLFSHPVFCLLTLSYNSQSSGPLSYSRWTCCFTRWALLEYLHSEDGTDKLPKKVITRRWE